MTENFKLVYALTDGGLAKLKAFLDDSTNETFIDAMLEVESAMDNGSMPHLTINHKHLVFESEDFNAITVEK